MQVSVLFFMFLCQDESLEMSLAFMHFFFNEGIIKKNGNIFCLLYLILLVV